MAAQKRTKDKHKMEQQNGATGRFNRLKKSKSFSKPQLVIFILAFALIGYLIFKSFAAAPLVASLEAEQMSPPAGASVITDAAASGGKALKLSANGTATGTVSFPSSVTSLSVMARGDACSGSPAMSLALDGASLLTNTSVASTSWSSYTYSFPSAVTTGSHGLSISFTNDYTNSGHGKKGNGACSRSLYLDVTNFYGPAPTTTPAPTVTLSASPASLTAGQASTLTWASTNADSCTASGAWSGTQATSGSASTGAINQTSTYTLTCSGAGGSASASASVSVSAASADVSVTINRSLPNGTSRWMQNLTMVDNQFYYPWGTNSGPDTTAGTAQYNARSMETQGESQQNVHIMAWGRSSPWPSPTSAAPNPNDPYGANSWGGGGMDQEIKRAADKGLKPTITLAMAPGWMEGNRSAGNPDITSHPADFSDAFYAARVTTDQLPQWLQLVDSIVRRYTVAPYNVRTFDIWNEFKGYYNPDTNNYDAGTYPGTPHKADMGYTYFYNCTRAQILASAQAVGVTSGIRTGGPYVVGDLWSISSAGGFPVNDGRGSSNNTLSGAKSYGYVDGRPLDAIKTWLQYKTGAEFISLRFSNGTKDKGVLGNDWDSLKYAGDLAQWVRGLPESTYPGASTLPFWDAEYYTGITSDSTVDAKYGAFSAEAYRIGVRNGYEAMLRWGPQGIDGVNLWSYPSAGGGQPGNGSNTEKLFKQNFSAGTTLYPESVSDSSKVSALANSTHTLLINKTNSQLTVSVNGTAVTLPAYGVVLVQA